MSKKSSPDIMTKLGIFLAASLGILAIYSYHIGDSIQSKSSVIEKLVNGISYGVEKLSDENETLSQAFDLEGKIEILQDEKNIYSKKIQLQGIEMYVNQTGLQQRISAENIIITSKNNQEDTIQGLDLILDESNTYFTVSKGISNFFSYVNILQGENRNETFQSKISKTIGEGKYVKIDNSQPIRDLFGENKLIAKLLTSILTSNPNKYLEKYKIYEELQKELYNDAWIGQVFELQNKGNNSGNNNTREDNIGKIKNSKETYILNTNICKNYIGNIVKVLEQYKFGNNTSESFGINCEKKIGEINKILPLVTQIYKQGDIKNGNYIFIVRQGSSLNIKIEYINHILQKWEIYAKNPENKSLELSAKGNKFGIIQSEFTINIQEKGNNITGKIINGNGNIKINIENLGIKNGNIIINNYILQNIDIEGKIDGDKKQVDISIIGNNDFGRINILYKDEKQDIKGNLTYTEKSYEFDVNTHNYNINSLYKGDQFILAYSGKDLEKNIDSEAKIVFDGNKVTAFFKNIDNEINIKSEIDSPEDFVIQMEVDNRKNNIEVQVNSVKKSDSFIQYSAYGNINKQSIFTFSGTKVGDGDISEIQGNLFIPSENKEIKIFTKIMNRNPGKGYSIPKNSTEVDIDVSQIIILPSIHKIRTIFQKKYIISGVALSVIGGSIAYIAKEKKKGDKINDIKKSDLQKISKVVLLKLDEGKLIKEIIISENTGTGEINIRIAGGKLIEGENYFVGKINFEILGLDITEFEGRENSYMIAAYIKNNIIKYQLLSFLDQGKGNKVYVEGSYIPRELQRYDFIINDTEDEIIQITINGTHDLQIGDITNIGKILEINENIVTVENKIQEGMNKVYLLGNDANTLFMENNRVLKVGQVIDTIKK